MDFLRSYPATSIFIAVAIFAAVAGCVLWRWHNKPGTNRPRFARYLFAAGVVQIVVGLILTAMTISQGDGRIDSGVYFGIFTCWIAWASQRASPDKSQSGDAETRSPPQR